MNEIVIFREQSQLALKEIQLYHKQLRDQYGENIPMEILLEMTAELKHFREKYAAIKKKLFPEKWRDL
jgi:hypothetical protein